MDDSHHSDCNLSMNIHHFIQFLSLILNHFYCENIAYFWDLVQFFTGKFSVVSFDAIYQFRRIQNLHFASNFFWKLFLVRVIFLLFVIRRNSLFHQN